MTRRRLRRHSISRRSASASFDEVRAIPWVFSWLQSRHVLPGYYGLGAAFDAFAEHPGGVGELRYMHACWPFFRIMVGNAALSAAKADMGIARLYAGLVEDEGVRDRVFGAVEAEHERTRRRILEVTGHERLLEDEPTVRAAIDRRNPRIDPLSFMQVDLLRRLRARDDPESEETESLQRLVDATILGVAAGLKNTG